MINQFDLTQYQCPMNLVMAKQYFFELKNGSSAIFILHSINKAPIENVIAFLQQKQIKYTITNIMESTYIAFTKPTLQTTNIVNVKKTQKKQQLKTSLQENIKRRKNPTLDN